MDESLNTPVADPDLLATLPPVIRAVVKALGLVRARELLLAHGGVNVTVAKHHSRVLGVSDDELSRLRDHLKPHLDHNGRLWLPKADKILRLARNAQIKRESGKASINSQARQYDLSSRQILNIRRDDDERRQVDLF